MLLKGILKTSHGSMITLSRNPPIFSSSSPPIDGIIFQHASACLLSLINELILQFISACLLSITPERFSHEEPPHPPLT